MIKHNGPISGVASHGGRHVATAGYDNQVILWDAATQRPLARSLHDHLANQVQFSPDGSLLLSSSSDYTARLWTVPELKLVAVFSDQSDDVEMSAFHPGRDFVATASRDHRVRVYDLTGRLLHTFEGHEADVISIEWCAHDELLSSSDDGTLRRWSLSSDTAVATYDLNGVETDTIAITSSGRIYAGNDDGAIVTIEGDRVIATTPAHDAGIKRLVYDPARGRLISLSYDRVMRVWDTQKDLQPVVTASMPAEVWPRSCTFLTPEVLVFATFGTTYATYDWTTGTWDLSAVADTPGVNAALRHESVTWCVGDAGVVWRDEKQLATTGSLCNFLAAAGDLAITGGQMGIVFDASTGAALHQHRSPLNCATAFLRGGEPHVVVGAYTGEGLVFRVVQGGLELVAVLDLHPNAVKGIAAVGETVFSVAADSSATWTDINSLEVRHHLPEAHGRIANGCVALADGGFASVSRDLRLRLWPSGSGAGRPEAVMLPSPHEHSIKCVTASGDGRYVATGSYNGTFAVWDRVDQSWSDPERISTAGLSSLSWAEDLDLYLASSYDGRVYEVSRTGESLT